MAWSFESSHSLCPFWASLLWWTPLRLWFRTKVPVIIPLHYSLNVSSPGRFFIVWILIAWLLLNAVEVNFIPCGFPGSITQGLVFTFISHSACSQFFQSETKTSHDFLLGIRTLRGSFQGGPFYSDLFFSSLHCLNFQVVRKISIIKQIFLIYLFLLLCDQSWYRTHCLVKNII